MRHPLPLVLIALPLLATATPSRAATVTFGVIGDFGDDDDDTRAVAAMMHLWGLDLVVTVGDNDYTDGAHRGTNAGLEAGVGQFFADFIGDYRGEYGPGAAANAFFPTPGDHDWGDTCDDPAGLDDYLAYFTLPTDRSPSERYYAVRRGPVDLFMLDSVEDCEVDGVSPTSAQGQWLQAALAASDAPFQVVVSHHPPYSSGEHQGDGDHMRWPFREWGADLVLSGHDHDYERVEHDGLTYVVNGLGGNDRRGFSDPVAGSVLRYADEHGAMRVTATDDALTLAFVTVHGEVIDAFTVAPGGATAATTVTPPPGAPLDLIPTDDGGGDGCAGSSAPGRLALPALAALALLGLLGLLGRRRAQRSSKSA